jgi:hypothetical protein
MRRAKLHQRRVGWVDEISTPYIDDRMLDAVGKICVKTRDKDSDAGKGRFYVAPLRPTADGCPWL